MASRRDIERRIRSVRNTRKITRAMELVAAARLRRAEARLQELGIEATLVEAIGDIASAVVEVGEAHDAGLIVIGTREPSQVERMLGHSVSESVQRMAHCDVLIVH